MAKKRYEFKDGKSARFWEIDTKGTKTIVRYGRIGGDGRRIEKTHASTAAAKADAKKLISQKTSKGYESVSSSSQKKAVKKSASKKVAVKKKAKASKAVRVKPGDTVNVTGIIEATPAGGAQADQSGKIWTLVTGFQRWKFSNGEVIKGTVRIEQPNLTARQLTNRMKQIKPYSIRRLCLKIDRHPRMGLMGIVLKDYGLSKDGELVEIVQQLKKPAGFKDPDLGKFEFQREYSWFESKRTKWMDSKIGMSLEVKNEKKPELCLEFARKLWKKQKSWDKKVKDYIVVELLEIANDWLHESASKQVSATTFRKRIKLNSISIDERGDFIFWFDADNIFTEHGICVYGNVSGKLKEATIA